MRTDNHTMKAIKLYLGLDVHNDSITAMAHKLARILWHLIKYRQPYDPNAWAISEAKLGRKKVKRLEQSAAALGFKLICAS